MNNIITVVYATDLSYLNYTIVSAFSMLKNLNGDYSADLVFLVPQDNCDDFKALIEKSLSCFNNYSLRIIRMNNEFDNVQRTISRITTPTYYRLALAELLPEVDKCIYLDGDTIVDGDISKLWTVELEDNWVAGVKAFNFYNRESNIRRILEYPDDDEFIYINVGVLLINLKKIRFLNLRSEFNRLLSKQYPLQDQDIINKACVGHIKTLPMFYNAMTIYVNEPYNKIKKWVDKAELVYSREHPLIIHFAANIKPWNDVTMLWADKWFEYCLHPSLWSLFYNTELETIKQVIKDNGNVVSKKKRTNIFTCVKRSGFKHTMKKIFSIIFKNKT